MRSLLAWPLGVLCLLTAAGAACSDQTVVPTPLPVVVSDAGVDAGPGGDSGARRAGVIRIATFNVRRFFDTVCESGTCAAGGFEEAPSKAVFDAKVATLAKGIAVIDPDVIALEEVETAACLEALAAQLASMGKKFPIAHLGEIGYRGSLDVAVLSRGGLPEIKTHRDVPLTQADGTKTTFTRELLEVRMVFGARKVVVFAAHFRSQATDDPARRLAEAKGAQAILARTAAELPDALVVLAGDMNDTPGSEPINALEAGGTLVRVAKDLPVDEQATYVFQGTKAAIDHIFVAASQAARYLPKSAAAYRDDPRGSFAGSDHAALGADFSIE